MKRILIPTDFSPNSKNAIRYALDLFQDTSCQFYILHVNVEGSDFVEKPAYELGTNVLVKKEPKSINKKIKDLEKFISSISSKRKHHNFTTIREHGTFLNSIRKQILEKQIDLILMGTHGASELKEFFTGTRSGDVITKVEADVLVIPDKAKYEGFEKLVFPIDFEITYNDTILQKAANLISSQKTQIKLLYVTKSHIPLFEEIEQRQKSLVERLSKLLPNPISFQRVASRKIEDGVRIFGESINADLIIMISKDYGLFQKWFLDTAVEEVSFETSIPLLSLQG